MLENVGRKVTLIVTLLAVSLGLMLFKDKPFNLGLDLQGGTRLVYTVDFEQAYQDGTLSRSEDPNQVLDQMIQIIRNRVDPKGVLEPQIRRSEQNRIIIELPGTLGLPTVEAQSVLLEEVPDQDLPEGDYLSLEKADDFPESGVVTSGVEQIRYGRKSGNRLEDLERQVNGTSMVRHASGEAVVLQKDDAFRTAIESLGELSFQIVAAGGYFPAGTDEATERKKLQEWLEANPGAPLVAFNRVPPDQGGPHPDIEWFPHKTEGQSSVLLDAEKATPVLRTTGEERFTGGDLARVYPAQDDIGFPAVGFEMRPSRRDDFGDFTRKHKNRFLAIILNDEVVSAPTIQEELRGEGIIRGQFNDQEVKDLITVLRSGSLKIKPQLENDERVGATLGQDYVKRGIWAGITSLLAVVVFTIAYYRKLGVFATLALIANFTLIMGGMAFLNATLTLPGIAGLILTIGMAVDSNILVFERIREELKRGRNVKQAAKNGFDKALSAILDSNITTIITALILYRIGTGPVRGFAVTLTVGIVFSVFSVLVVTRVLIHFALVRGTQTFSMGQWMINANYRFLAYTKPAVAFSLLLIVGGLTWFVVTPDAEKLGVDFLGGVEAQIRAAEPASVDSVRARVAAIPGIGESADVKAVLNSARGGGFTLFRVTFKEGQGGQKIGADADTRALLRKELQGLLLQDPVQVDLGEEASPPKVELTLLFEEGHPTADIQKKLEEIGLSDVVVNPGEAANEYRATATAAPGMTENEIRSSLTLAFTGEDSTGAVYRVAQDIPAYTHVGPQVVGELRDNALLALAASLFAVVLYLRVRFAEYSYGIAAAVAVFHDVLVTLGLTTIANHFGIVNGEITLTMIAVYLTIIGYSLNDTIVIFDRVRENLPRMKGSLADVINTSVNQTLSRTILTAFTVFMSVVILYVFNFGTGNVIESFAFAMMIGTVTGTYSTVYIANPILLWWESRWGRLAQGGGGGDKPEREKREGEDEAKLVQV